MAARVHTDRQSDYSPTNLTGGDFILKIDFIDTSDIKKQLVHILFFLTCTLVLRAYWRVVLPSGHPLARTSSLRRWDTPPCSWGPAAVTIQRRETRGNKNKRTAKDTKFAYALFGPERHSLLRSFYKCLQKTSWKWYVCTHTVRAGI